MGLLSLCSRAMPQIYSTNKEVKLLDRKLGLLYGSIILIVLGYVVGVRIIIEKSYMSTEEAYGVVGIELNGTSYNLIDGTVQPVDVASLITPRPEGDALFLPTRTLITTDQRLGNCSSPDAPCVVHSDCLHQPPLSPGLCDNGGCVRYQWCNPGPDGLYTVSQQANPFTGSRVQTSKVAVLQELGRLSVVLIADISFHDSGVDALSTDFSITAEPDRPLVRIRWTMAQLLQRAGMTEAQAQRDGGVLGVSLYWDCGNLAESATCMPKLKVKQLAPSRPFYHEWADYYRRGADPSKATLYRDLHQARGLRLLVTTEGKGKQFDLNSAMMQLFVALALMPVRLCARAQLPHTCPAAGRGGPAGRHPSEPPAHRQPCTTPGTSARARGGCESAPTIGVPPPDADCISTRRHYHAARVLGAATLPGVQDRKLARLFGRARKGRTAREADAVAEVQGHELCMRPRDFALQLRC